MDAPKANATAKLARQTASAEVLIMSLCDASRRNPSTPTAQAGGRAVNATLEDVTDHRNRCPGQSTKAPRPAIHHHARRETSYTEGRQNPAEKHTGTELGGVP